MSFCNLPQNNEYPSGETVSLLVQVMEKPFKEALDELKNERETIKSMMSEN